MAHSAHGTLILESTEMMSSLIGSTDVIIVMSCNTKGGQ